MKVSDIIEVYFKRNSKPSIIPILKTFPFSLRDKRASILRLILVLAGLLILRSGTLRARSVEDRNRVVTIQICHDPTKINDQSRDQQVHALSTLSCARFDWRLLITQHLALPLLQSPAGSPRVTVALQG